MKTIPAGPPNDSMATIKAVATVYCTTVLTTAETTVATAAVAGVKAVEAALLAITARGVLSMLIASLGGIKDKGTTEQGEAIDAAPQSDATVPFFKRRGGTKW